MFCRTNSFKSKLNSFNSTPFSSNSFNSFKSNSFIKRYQSQSNLQCVMLMTRDMQRSVEFYRDGLDCSVNHVTESWSELESGGIKLAFKRADGEAACTTGYSPFLSFNVKDLDTKIYKLLEMGANLDGPIKYPEHGKIAAVRAPDGHMIGLFEPVVGSEQEKQEETDSNLENEENQQK